MVGAELPRLLLDERLADPLETAGPAGRRTTCRGNRTNSAAAASLACGNFCFSAAGTWPVNPCSTGVMPSSRWRREDLLLQLGVTVDPATAAAGRPSRRCSPSSRTASRPARPETARSASSVEPQSPAHRLPDRLLAGDRQRHVDAVQGHPVDHPLPLRPVPPGHRVAERAVVEEVAVLEAGSRGGSSSPAAAAGRADSVDRRTRRRGSGT